MTAFFRIGSLGLMLLMALACSRDAADPLQEIRALHDEERFGASLQPLRRILDRDPTQIEANLLLGRALLRTGQPGLAIWPLGRASEAPEYAVQAGLMLAQAMLASRSSPDAVAALDRVLAAEPENVDALALRAEAYLETSRLEEALADTDRVLEIDPDNLAVLVPRVIALISSEQIDEAEAAIAVARERFDSAPDLAASLRARLCVVAGLFAFEKGDEEAAEAQYAECLEASPTEPLTVIETVAYYQRTGRGEEATEILRSAYEETRSAYFRLALAQRMGALGDLEEQERLLREEAEERPSWLAWFRVADLLVQREEWDAALEAFRKALAATPSPSSKLLFAYADTLIRAKRYAGAREVLQQIGPPELRHLIRGRLLLAEGDPERALAAFEAGIRLWPNNAVARFLAGEAAERVGNFPRASSHYRESLRAAAGQSEAGLALARLYQARGDLDGALDAVGRYLRTHPQDPEGYLLTVRIAHAAENYDLAASGLERLALLPGQTPMAVAEEARLVAERRGPVGAVEVIERSELDLTDPASAPALRVLLVQLAEQGEHERAERQILAALEANPEAAVFHELRGRTLRAAGAPADAARDAFQRAVELDPDDARALLGLAELAAEADDREAAIALYDRAAEADPDDAAPALAAAELVRAEGRTQAARQRLERLLAEHPRDGEVAIALARILEGQDELERAAAYARRAAWLRTPESVEILERIQGAQAAPGDAPAG